MARAMFDAVTSPEPSAPTATRSSRDVWPCRGLLIALVFITFGRLIGFGYAEWDDAGTIFANPSLRSVSLETFFDAWTEPHMAICVPVTHSVWAFLAGV